MTTNEGPVIAPADVRRTESPSKPRREGLFIITCAARTGSSMLVNLLQSHPAITCHMEIFNPDKVNGFFGDYRERLKSEDGYEERLRAFRRDDAAGFLYKIAFDAQQRRTVGFKFKYDEFLLPVFAAARHVIMRDQDIRIIHLRRRNLLRRYLSWCVVNHVTHVTMVREGDVPPSRPPVRLDPVACRADFEETERRAALVKAMLASHATFDLDYEDVAGDGRAAVLERLQRFLGVEVRSLRTVLTKLASDDLRQQIANFDEIASAFSGTPWARFLEE